MSNSEPDQPEQPQPEGLTETHEDRAKDLLKIAERMGDTPQTILAMVMADCDDAYKRLAAATEAKKRAVKEMEQRGIDAIRELEEAAGPLTDAYHTIREALGFDADIDPQEVVDAVARMREALKLIRDNRDHRAETGKYLPGTMQDGPNFDDWAADVADAALTPAEGEQADADLAGARGNYSATLNGSVQQPCGHPTSEIVSSGEGTNFCGACEREAKR